MRPLPATILMLAAAAVLGGGARTQATQAQGGELDPTFGTGGTVGESNCGIRAPVFLICDRDGRAVAVQDDGKLVVAGSNGLVGSGAFYLQRYSENGFGDPTFLNPNPSTDFGPGFDAARAVAVQPDGRIVAAGVAGFTDSQPSRFALARYLPDGSLDPDFGAGGLVTTTMGLGGAEARSMVIQADGKLVVAGSARRTGPFALDQFALARYLPDGSLDATFGIGGRVVTRFIGGAAAFALLQQPDGRLVAAGVAFETATLPRGFALVRYLPDGSPDPSFGVGGRAVARSPQLDLATALVLQPSGSLVAGGGARSRTDGVFALMRFTSRGALDTSFGSGGVVFTDFGAGADSLTGLAIQEDGKLVAIGSSESTDFALARYTPDGLLDPGFGSGGKVMTDFFGTAHPTALAVQAGGKIVGAGTFDAMPPPPFSQRMFALARYLP